MLEELHSKHCCSWQHDSCFQWMEVVEEPCSKPTEIKPWEATCKAFEWSKMM